MKQMFVACAICLTALAAGGAALALDRPVVLEPAVVLDPLSKGGAKSDVRYYGQPARKGVIDLTATNGFFDSCFQAVEPGPGIDADKGFIVPTFGSLKRMSPTERGTARWHLWVAEPGEIQATFFLAVPPAEAGHEWLIRAGDEVQTLKAKASDGKSAQRQTLVFKIGKPGRVTLAIDCTKAPPPAETRLHCIRLQGAAVANASLLRTRWRPAAVHARFAAPPECPAPNMWVFESVAVSKTTSYSPMTTAFGYYGASFNQDGVIAAGAGFNFSMWAASRGATAAPPLARMPRLIGTGIPEAKYDTFGHEGTGVKFRDAVAYPHGAQRTIQALRIEPTADGLLTYYGYFYDEPAGRWKLYASAQAPPKNPADARKANFGVLSSTGSFCEIPGPPQRQRSGDVVREIKRRGWFHGQDGDWRRAVIAGDANPPPADPEEPKDDGPITNKRVRCLDDNATAGWMSMSTGGIEYHLASADRRPPAEPRQDLPLPEYLKPEKAKQLFALPVEFGRSEAKSVSARSATIGYELKKTGPNSKGILHYGTVDCLAFPQKTVKKGSAAEIDMARPERTWQFATREQRVAAGMNRFPLADLKAKTPYHYRLFVTHDEGKSWDYQSGHFTTK